MNKLTAHRVYKYLEYNLIDVISKPELFNIVINKLEDCDMYSLTVNFDRVVKSYVIIKTESDANNLIDLFKEYKEKWGFYE